MPGRQPRSLRRHPLRPGRRPGARQPRRGQGAGRHRARRSSARRQDGGAASYVSIWDAWYRFRLFALAAYDYEAQEPLFVAGQGRDNRVSNEDVVMKETFAQFHKAIAAR